MNRSSRYLRIAAYVVLLFIFIFAISMVRNCSKVTFIPREGFSQGDTIDIALLFVPGSYYHEGDSLSGINYEIAEEFIREINRPVKFWPVAEPADALDKLESGAFDILASLPLDNSLKSRFPVSESVFLDRLVLVQLNDTLNPENNVNSSLDLNGKKVYVTEGSSAKGRLINLSDEIGGHIEIEPLQDMSDELLCLQVANGKIPLAVVNRKVAEKMSELYPDLRYDSSISFTQFQVWVFNRDDTELCANFNAWFLDFKNTPRYQDLNP